VCIAVDPSNMQWQSVAEGKTKDKWERKGGCFYFGDDGRVHYRLAVFFNDFGD